MINPALLKCTKTKFTFSSTRYKQKHKYALYDVWVCSRWLSCGRKQFLSAINSSSISNNQYVSEEVWSCCVWWWRRWWWCFSFSLPLNWSNSKLKTECLTLFFSTQTNNKNKRENIACDGFSFFGSKLFIRVKSNGDLHQKVEFLIHINENLFSIRLWVKYVLICVEQQPSHRRRKKSSLVMWHFRLHTLWG